MRSRNPSLSHIRPAILAKQIMTEKDPKLKRRKPPAAPRFCPPRRFAILLSHPLIFPSPAAKKKKKRRKKKANKTHSCIPLEHDKFVAPRGINGPSLTVVCTTTSLMLRPDPRASRWLNLMERPLLFDFNF